MHLRALVCDDDQNVKLRGQPHMLLQLIIQLTSLCTFTMDCEFVFRVNIYRCTVITVVRQSSASHRAGLVDPGGWVSLFWENVGGEALSLLCFCPCLVAG